ncbi:DUF4129 domain-containing protein [Methanofollis formosanus]|uniref:DUF4129 domain-containing protein n=1 Tax=Methanofollis formosanus TaxID=299308 RepID=A0A8G1EGH9_9EURY|nr:DUF4129 domain-containing protein [Methanofollis formosanus]QYZ79815.1 DUF4129 domain-containing protein [Methanofollis formosanus]
MKRIILGVLVLACLALIVFHAQEPMLYTAENTSSIGEVDLSVAEKMDSKKAEAVMPLLQDLLGQGGTVVLSVKVKDWESAQEELEEYAEMTRSMDNLVLSLDLSETDLDEFRKKSQENRDALTSLVNGTARLDHLKQLEITYRDSDDPSKYYSVVYEEEALREELQSSYKTYAGNSPALTTIGDHYEADTADLKQSVEDYGEIVEKETGGKAPAPGPGIPPPQIGIALAPAEAVYGDVVRWHGRLGSGEVDVAVESYLDSRLFATTATGADGKYAVSCRIEKVRAGPHLVYVQAGRAVSDLVPFTVLTSPSNLSLGVTVEDEVATCTGNLTANERGVRGAGVRIIVDDAVAARPVTGENGTYEAAVPLEAGEHRIRAEFTAEGYPLDPSSSEEIRVQIGFAPFSPANLIPIAGGVVVGLLAGAVFLRWSRRQPEAAQDREIAHSQGEPIMTAEETAIRDVQIPIEPQTPAEAAFRLWNDLADAAGIEYGVKNARAHTPRELVQALKETPGAESAGAFVKIYERIRYAGGECTWDEVEELERLLGAFRGSRAP